MPSTPSCQQLIDVAQAQGKAEIEPDGVTDDLGREAKPGVRGANGGRHPSRYRGPHGHRKLARSQVDGVLGTHCPKKPSRFMPVVAHTGRTRADLGPDRTSRTHGVLSRSRGGMMQNDTPTVWCQLKNLRNPVSVRPILSMGADRKHDGTRRREQFGPERQNVWWREIRGNVTRWQAREVHQNSSTLCL